MNTILFGFFIYLLIVLGIGIWTYRLTKTQEDFIIAGRKLNPIVTAFSERASGESAWLLLGLPGAVFAIGLIEIWVALGCIIGIILAWYLIASDLRIKSEENGALTIPEFFSRNFGLEDRKIELLATFIVIFFYSFYISAQFNGAGKTLNVSFGIPHFTGMVIGASVIVIYTLLGGFFAVAWTDFFQAIIMIITLVILPIVGLFAFLKSGNSLDLSFKTLVGNKRGIDALMGVLGGLSWAFGYLGQPHTIVRFMAIKDPRKIKTSRAIAIWWSFPAFLGAFLIGVVGRGLISQNTLKDPEQLMPYLATSLFPLWLAGILISGAIAAMMSTADSQLLVISSSFSEDIYHDLFRRKISEKAQLFASRIITMLVGVAAFILALLSKHLIFATVAFAWCGLGASFGPALLLTLKWKKTNKNGVMLGMLTGFLSTILWKLVPLLNELINERIATFALGTIGVILGSLLTTRRKV
ncbi:MAG: sodium/proline symporter [candidate division WOR-3 bacterium]